MSRKIRDWFAPANIISVGALIVSAIALVESCNARRTARVTSEAERRAAFAPCLRVVQVKFGDTAAFSPVHDLRFRGCTLAVNATGCLPVELTVTNSNPTPARFLFALAAWSKSHDLMLKASLDSAVRGMGHSRYLAQELPGPGSERSIFASDTVAYRLGVGVPSYTLHAGSAILHCLVVYAGIENMLYYTYAWTATEIASAGAYFYYDHLRDSLFVVGSFATPGALQPFTQTFNPKEERLIHRWWKIQAGRF